MTSPGNAYLMLYSQYISKYTPSFESVKGIAVRLRCYCNNESSQCFKRFSVILCYLISAYAFSNVIFYKFLPVFGALASPVSWFVSSLLFLFNAKKHIVTLSKEIDSLLTPSPKWKGQYIKFCNDCFKYYANCLWLIVSTAMNYLLGKKMGKKVKEQNKLDRKSERWLKTIIDIFQSVGGVKFSKDINRHTKWKESLNWGNKDKVSYEEVKYVRAHLYDRIKAMHPSRLSSVHEFKSFVLTKMKEVKALYKDPKQDNVNVVDDQLQLDLKQLIDLFNKSKCVNIDVLHKSLSNLIYKRINNDIKASPNEYLIWFGPYFGTLNAILNGVTNATMMFFGGGKLTFSVITSFFSGFIQSEKTTKPKAIKTFSFMSSFYFKQLNQEQIFAFFLGFIMAVASGVLNYCLWSPFLVGIKGAVIVSASCVYAGLFAFGLYAHSTVKNSDEMVEIVLSIYNKIKKLCSVILQPFSWPKVIRGFYNNISMQAVVGVVKSNFNEVVSCMAGTFMALYYGMMVYEQISSYIVVALLTAAIFPVWRALFKTTLMDILFSSNSLNIKEIELDEHSNVQSPGSPKRVLIQQICDTPFTKKAKGESTSTYDRVLLTPNPSPLLEAKQRVLEGASLKIGESRSSSTEGLVTPNPQASPA